MDQSIIRVLVALVAAATIVVKAHVHPPPPPPPPPPTPCPTRKGCSAESQMARYQSQLFLSGCDAVVDVEKRDDSKEIDFYVCVKKGKVCTDRDVSACSSLARGTPSCENFKPPFDKQFRQMFPKAYAEVCVEPFSGEQCLYTDVVYDTCEEAETMNENEICITLSNGEVECAEIPREFLIQKMRQAVAQGRLPQYRPLARMAGARSQGNTEARKMNDNVICITLSNGEKECAEVPQRQDMGQSHRARINGKLPPYQPSDKK